MKKYLSNESNLSFVTLALWNAMELLQMKIDGLILGPSEFSTGNQRQFQLNEATG